MLGVELYGKPYKSPRNNIYSGNPDTVFYVLTKGRIEEFRDFNM